MALDEKYPLALPQGTILAGQYVIEQALGQGGFGITYKATDHKTGKSVAVKEFFPDSMASRTTQTTVTAFPGERGESFAYGKGCFLQEAETLAEFIGNENIVRVYSYFEENGTAYFVMEFIEGTSFDQYIKDQGGKVSYEEAEKILLPVIDALALVHSKGIVHRDVTPDNIYITKDGRVKLLDFGAARYSLGDKSRSLDVVLKHGFAPKEQYTRHGRQGPYTDVYTVGASFYFAITGRRPQDSIDRMDEDELIPPSRLGVKIAPKKEDAILKAMSVQPSSRYQTMADFRQALMGAGETGTQTVQEAMPEATTQPQVQQRVFTAPQQNIEPQPTPQPMSTQQQPIPQSTLTQQQQVPQQGEAEKKKKWILPAGIGAGVVLAAVVIIAVASSGKDTKKGTVHYEVEEDPVIASNTVIQPESNVNTITEPESNVNTITEPESNKNSIAEQESNDVETEKSIDMEDSIEEPEEVRYYKGVEFYGDYVLEDSSYRYYDEYDLWGLSSEQLRIARNEIYARHGRRFQDEELQSYFDECDWYIGIIEPEDFDQEKVFNDYEKANVIVIQEYEKGLKD